jgi:hypothetical protein
MDPYNERDDRNIDSIKVGTGAQQYRKKRHQNDCAITIFDAISRS